MHLLTVLLLPSLVAATLESCLRSASVPVTTPTTPYNLRQPYKALAVAAPTTVSQISSAVLCGVEAGVGVSAKSGGHSYTSQGYGSADGQLVINLDRMYAVTVAASGLAKIQTGARLGHVATELYKQGKRALSHGTCPAVGVGGHALHGGHGMVSRKYGLMTDSIRGATVVLANGTVTYCSAAERPNLFWSIRGAGSSSVIVAELEFETFAAPPQVTYFDISLVWDVNKVPQVLLDAQSFAATMPAELTMAVTFNNDGYYINGACVGSDANFKSAVQPLLTKLGVKVSSSKTVGWLEFIEHYGGVPQVDITTPNYNEHETFYASSIATPALTRTAFTSLAAAVAKSGLKAPRSWFMHMNLHGGATSAITRPKPNDTAYVHRDKMLLFQLKDSVPNSQAYPADGYSLLQGFRESISKNLGSGEWGMYVNYPDSQISTADAPELYWGSNLERLEWIKEDYDPNNVFRNKQSIKPAE
ncbi:FAD-linked oxidoreductase sorD [Colletotrichum orbiculare MAFF 240422]|uniref:FAD-linked oxidoreductase sorD n=1 Tax=Colletotrichum orbiculare (strain 104-T / ATCC 96160 / CBS 514.97 / LARS 414 / MAFF 240422) TaxID=1213857 RepID=N4VC07_COLOR|nr:FAD-linked oxidoreductase sorD [Colletotrichum orbiculare MAFF 240422]